MRRINFSEKTLPIMGFTLPTSIKRAIIAPFMTGFQPIIGLIMSANASSELLLMMFLETAC